MRCVGKFSNHRRGTSSFFFSTVSRDMHRTAGEWFPQYLCAKTQKKIQIYKYTFHCQDQVKVQWIDGKGGQRGWMAFCLQGVLQSHMSFVVSTTYQRQYSQTKTLSSLRHPCPSPQTHPCFLLLLSDWAFTHLRLQF